MSCWLALIVSKGIETKSTNASNEMDRSIGKEMSEALDRIEKSFTYHRPKGDQPDRYEDIREKAKEFAFMIEDLCPESRERSLAMTHLENAVMWANAAIARNE